MMSLPLCNTPGWLKPRLDGHVKVTRTSLELIILLKFGMNWCDLYKKNKNECSSLGALSSVCVCVSMYICKYVLLLDKNEYIPYPHFLDEQSWGSNPEQEHLSAARLVFFWSCEHIYHLYLKLLTCEGGALTSSSDLFQNNLDFCPPRCYMSKCSIISMLFPGAIKSFQVLPAALTHALLFTAFNVGNSGI